MNPLRFCKLALLISIAAALSLGCGGSGGGSSAARGLTKEQLAQLLHDGVLGIDNLPSGPGSGNRPQSRSKAPRHLSSLKSRVASAKKATRQPDDVYWNSDWELWAVDFIDGDPSGVHDWGAHFFLDEAATVAAGDDITHSVWNQWPETDDETVTITNGPHTGAVVHDHMKLNQDGTGSEKADGTDPLYGSFEYTMTWPADGISTVTAKYIELDGTWTRYHAEPRDDGGNDYTITTSAGVKMTLHYAGDFSGVGTITGSNALLPATLEWDTNGDGTVHWADGSTSTFTNWDF